MGYSHFWKKLGYQIGFSQSRDNEQQHRDDRFYVNFTLPLGERVQSPIFSTVLNYNKGEKTAFKHPSAVSLGKIINSLMVFQVIVRKVDLPAMR